MQVITALKPSAGALPRYRVYVGSAGKAGRRAAVISPNAVDALGLAVGMDWTPELAARVEEASAGERAVEAAARALSRRPKSKRKLDQALRQKEFDPAARAQAIERMERIGAIDDRSLGESMVRSTLGRKPAGPRYLKAKLRSAGLDDELAQELADQASQTRDETGVEGARALVRVKLRGMRGLAPEVKRRRLYGMLARRGFDPDVISRVLSESHDNPDDVG
ncbi:MAG: regulatory protein RecX [Planctomycetota bacterium]